LNGLTLVTFRRGAELDAQVRYNGSHEYANYVYGVYLSAAGWDLQTALEGANDYGRERSVYRGTTMDLKYIHIPADNVRNITLGYTDQRNGTMCTVSGR
jgi:hypothetical protein